MSTWWNRRAALLRNSRLDQLLVITDFDATITTGDSVQCHDMLGVSELMSPPFRQDFAPLLDWASNPDTDGVQWCVIAAHCLHSLSPHRFPPCAHAILTTGIRYQPCIASRARGSFGSIAPHSGRSGSLAHGICRWDRAHELMIEHGQPPRHLIPRMVRETKMVPRPGALKLLARLAALDVPVLIVSAGLSDVIEEFLRQHNALTENITVCSNRLNYGADSAPQSVSPDPPITSFTKDTAYRASSTFFRQHSHRTTLIVIGDSCSDIDAATHVPHQHSLSIGFLNGKEIHNDSAVKHLQTYDAIVLGHDGSLEPVDAVIDELASHDPTITTPVLTRMMKHVKAEERRSASKSANPLRTDGSRGD